MVTIKHKDGSEEKAGFDRSTLHFILSAPLAQGDRLTGRSPTLVMRWTITTPLPDAPNVMSSSFWIP